MSSAVDFTTTTPNKTPAKKRKRKASGNNDIEVEEIVVNGEKVIENLDNDDEPFDPSLLCSVEITAVDRSRSSSPELKKAPKISTPRGPLKLSNSMFKKKKKVTPVKKKPKKKRSGEIEEITLTDDEDENSTSYVTQSDIDQSAENKLMAKANKFINNDDIDSDVSLE